MIEKIGDMELVSFKATMMGNSTQVHALVQSLTEKEIIAEEAFYDELKRFWGRIRGRKTGRTFASSS